jgi:hypothetical protein
LHKESIAPRYPLEQLIQGKLLKHIFADYYETFARLHDPEQGGCQMNEKIQVGCG